MKRMHIHVAVDNLADSIRFYSAMFGNVEPTVIKSDYCKWELSDPVVNFAISQRGAKPGVDHIGIQVETDEELAEMNARFAAAEVPVQHQSGTTCCYAKSDKAWTVDPQGVAWETFLTLESAPIYGQSHTQEALAANEPAAACCAPSQTSISGRGNQ
ncbi:glyoxalase/bleomycin resistance/dioxygenase family protein [Paraburkholderia sp. 31.1]|uniref:ArsI/CadI family heavy metal resistance metalloenzyme n=1 Tax=Paraburkholderia sp. 31.1 TaxID=2615205 RepID=UPI0016565CA7|nr:ArsI/CadI family heavy metal resistance metalloenzyme [Paraburkholderia sp. 31.1]MBC8723307.1 glyoxalase/bleomycin resistance/dioxygenase family protein [Paraburkholderia sp. 31.1]